MAFFKLSFFILIALSLGACQKMDRSPEKAKIHHVVLIWLKDSGNDEHRQQIIDISKTFKDIPGVLEVHAGKMHPGKREIVDSSYDVGIYLNYANQEDLQQYLDHPIHVKAVKTVLKPLMKKVLVYDFVSP